MAHANSTPGSRTVTEAASSLSQTDWSMIFEARGDDPAGEPDAAMNRLMRRYWPAVYAFVRRSGRDVHEAADVTQGFVCDVVLGRRLLRDADPARGRFRSLLLASLRNYLRERHRFDTRRRRAPRSGPAISLEAEHLEHLAPGSGPTPETAFSAQWAAALIDAVLRRVRESCVRDGLGPHWSIFEERVVRPMLFGTPPVAYEAIVSRLGLESVPQAANMTVTVKRRFARALRKEVAQTVEEPWHVEEEMKSLRRDLEQMS
jgi:RNA polymerase sigma-70 factor (ECF subfamily)